MPACVNIAEPYALIDPHSPMMLAACRQVRDMRPHLTTSLCRSSFTVAVWPHSHTLLHATTAFLALLFVNTLKTVTTAIKYQILPSTCITSVANSCGNHKCILSNYDEKALKYFLYHPMDINVIASCLPLYRSPHNHNHHTIHILKVKCKLKVSV